MKADADGKTLVTPANETKVPPMRARTYGYPDRPLKEELVREITDPDGSRRAAITRNSYGALVLNSAALMFIDVDEPPEGCASSIVRGLSWLAGRRLPGPREEIQAWLAAWAARRLEFGTRLYETAGGFRLLLAARPVSPTSKESDDLLQDAGADPLYVRLCKGQECYRDRLTPKPWRCGLKPPQIRFPRESAQAEADFRAWEARYAQACASYATCRLLSESRQAPRAPEFLPLIAIHDEATRVSQAEAFHTISAQKHPRCCTSIGTVGQPLSPSGPEKTTLVAEATPSKQPGP